MRGKSILTAAALVLGLVATIAPGSAAAADDGKVSIAYTAPQALAARHGITDRAEVAERMTGALANLTDAAAKAS